MTSFTLFLDTHGHSKYFIFAHRYSLTSLYLFLLFNLSVTYNAIKEEPNMHILYFGCLATDLLGLLTHYFVLLW